MHDFSTGYDFAAESLNLLPLSASFRTQVARKLNINANTNFSFYQRDSTGRLLNNFLWDQARPRLARLTNASLSMSYQFNPSSKQKKSTINRPVAPDNDPVLRNPNRVGEYDDYIDFDIPWDLSTNFTANYVDPGPIPNRATRLRARALSTVSLNASGSVKLTENLRFGYSSGFDFVNKQVTLSSLDFSRDLHCWQITGNWRPFGPTRGYSVTIAAKSALLQDLKLNRNRTFLNRL